MIKLRIGKEEIIYSDDDLMMMNKSQLKQLKQDLQCNIEDVSAKKTRYQAENNESYNSKEYFKRIAKYKTAISAIKHSIAKVSLYFNNLKEDTFEKNEQWLWQFYISAKNILNFDEFKNIVSMVDEKTKYHIEIGE